jgi:hypothetical protein
MEPVRRSRLIPHWFIIALMLILAVPGLTLLVNHSPLGGVIVKLLRTEAGVEISSFRIKVIPRLRVEVSDIVVRNHQRPNAVLVARHGSFTVRLLPLLKKQVTIVQASIEQPRMIIQRDVQGHWHQPFERPALPVQDQADEGFRLEHTIPDVQLTGGELVVIDEYERAVPHQMAITNVQAMLKTHLFGRSADLTVTADLDRGGFSLTGLLSLAYAGSLMPSAGPAPWRFEGSVEATGVDVSPWIDAPRQSEAGQARARLLDLDGQVIVAPGSLGHDVTVSRAQASLSWVSLRGQGKIVNMGTDHAAYAATLSATPIALLTCLQEVPSGWIPPPVRSAITEHQLTGTVELISASASGQVRELRPDTWKGAAKMTQAGGRFGAGGTSIQNLSATLFLDPSHVDAIDISGQVGALRVSTGKASLSHLDVAPQADVFLTGSGKIRELLSLLHDVSEGAAGETVLKTFTDPQGEINLSIRAAGPLAPEPRMELISADITVHGLGAYMPALGLSAEHLDGTMRVKSHFIELKHLRGTFGPVRFDAVGGVSTQPAPRFEDMVVELSADGGDIRRMLSTAFAIDPDIIVEGMAQAKVHLAGPPASLRWRGHLDLSRIEVQAPPAVSKRQGVPSSVEFDGQWVPGRRLLLRHVALVLPSARVEGRADVRLAGAPAFTLRVNAGPLPLERLADGFSLGLLSAGVLDAAFTVKGGGTDWQTWTTTGRIDVTRGTMRIPGLRDPIRELSLGLQLTGRDLMIPRLSFRIGDSDLSATGYVKEWSKHPSPTLFVESSRLDLTRLLPNRGDGADDGLAFEKFRAWIMTSRADVTATIKQAHYYHLVFQTLAAHVHMEPGSLRLDIQKGETLQGDISGHLVASSAPHQPLAIEADLAINGMPVQHLVSVFDPDADRLYGLLSLTGGVRGTIHPPIPFLTTLDSREPLQIRLTEGRILHGTVLPKVLRILNVPAVLQGQVDLDHDGIPFDRISATVNMRDGVLSSETLFFDSPLLKVAGAGTLALDVNELNLALAVSPLGAYSELVGRIPLFGRLLEGDRPGLSTALFEVTGPVHDPDVRYLPIKSIAKGLTGYPRLAIDVLRNVISLPQELITPGPP